MQFNEIKISKKVFTKFKIPSIILIKAGDLNDKRSV